MAKRVGPCDIGFTDTPMGPDMAIRAKRVQSETGLAEIANRFGLARLAINGEVLLNFRTPHVSMGPAKVPLPVASFFRATRRAEALAQSKVSRVILVSCDPQSFARDAAILIAGGFTMEPVIPIDQFAHSAHVEAFACFDR